MLTSSLVEKVAYLYSLPDVAVRVNELLDSDKASNAELENIIVCDPALTAQLLKLVNSAHYGFPGAVDTVSRAVSLIGHKELRNMVMAATVTNTFKDIPNHLVDMETFWFHSITCAVLARSLAETQRCKERERFFIAGLLHSIGKLVLFSQYPKESVQVLSYQGQGDAAVIAAEQRIFGFTYADLSAALLKAWKLPDNIWQMVASQLDPLNAQGNTQEACVLHVAAKITASIEPCAMSTLNMEGLNPNYDPRAWQTLGLSEAQLKPLIWDTSSQAISLFGIIRPGSTLVF